MEDFARNLILAGEISGFLHDLGKLHPGFAKENLKGGVNLSDQSKKQTKIGAAHGAILEDGRIYPSAEELAQNLNLQDCLEQLLKHEGWAGCLNVPEAWLKTATAQVTGLGAPLRQHHAGHDWPDAEASLLGDLYAMGADIRDSALDKASSGAQKCKQHLKQAAIADTFGHVQQCYSPETLKDLWQQIPDRLAVLWEKGACDQVGYTRNKLFSRLDGLFLKALGETRRPTNDVTLRHHSFSTASHFKAALAEGVLRQDFSRWVNKKGLFDVGQMGLVRFRLLGIRWNWRELTRQAFRPVTLVSLTERRDKLIAAIRQKVEVEYPIGNIIYQDDDGVLILAPGFYEADANESENRFAKHILNPLQNALTGAVEKFFGSGTSFRLFWSEPTLYLTDYPEALGFNPKPDSPRQRFVQAGVATLHELWKEAPKRHAGSQIQICPQCGLRPAPTREFELVESSLTEQKLCDFCETLHANEAQEDRRKNAKTLFGFSPLTFNLQEIVKKRGQGNSRVALISVQVNTQALANGNALVTQLARPVNLLEENEQHWSANELGNWFESLLQDLHANNAQRLKTFEPVKDNDGKNKETPEAKQARSFIGDGYWLNKRDGRVMGQSLAANSLQIAQDFYFREAQHLPPELYRHDGDMLALFAQRKHPSPARLQRLWDDLRELWQAVLTEIAGLLGDYVIPLSLDAGGVRFLVAAQDATTAIKSMQANLEQRLNKIRGGFAPQVSCLVFREKFPLYLGLDAIYRMEERIPRLPHQPWTVKHLAEQAGKQQIIWQTPQGEVSWCVDLSTGDPEQIDLWHPHVIRSHDASGTEIKGPDRITHVTALKPGDTCLIPPATFDFMVLEGNGRRYQIVYNERDRQLYRPHLVFGQQGQAVGLLERFEAMASLVEHTGWKSSQVKALQGEMVELYEKWVRDVPEVLRDTGLMAWQTHVDAMLKRYLPKKEQAGLRAEMLAAVMDGRFFDAVEWSTFISKGGKSG